jgi:hypothetical protein
MAHHARAPNIGRSPGNDKSHYGWLKGCPGWPKTNPSNRDVQTYRLASADLVGVASRLRNESGHNLWL